jgi:hypothetical protein
MAWLLRLLSAVAAAITSLFVARDALNFGIIQTLLMITLIIGAAAIRRRMESATRALDGARQPLLALLATPPANVD